MGPEKAQEEIILGNQWKRKMGTTKFSIEKLNGKNYVCWAAQIKSFLMAKDLWGYIETSNNAESSEKAEKP